MQNTISRMKKSEEGFTLIELMIVMIVLGILAAIVIFAVDPFTDGADEKVNEANAKQCATANAAQEANGGALADYFQDGEVPAGCTDT